MTPLKNIRYSFCAALGELRSWVPHAAPGEDAIPTAAHRSGQRLGCLLRADEFSVGRQDHLYVALTPSLPPGGIRVGDRGFEPWFRPVAYGIAADFGTLAEDERVRYIEAATFEILATLNPEAAGVLATCRERLARHGARTRILRAAKDTKAYRFEVWFDVPTWGDTAYLYVQARELASGLLLAAPAIPLLSYEDAYPLVASISFVKGVVKLTPRASFQAGLATRYYPAPLQIALDEMRPVETSDYSDNR